MAPFDAASFDAVVFDLDGTLVDTAPDLHAHLNETLVAFGRPELDLAEVRPLIGDGARTLIQRGLETSGGLPAGTDLDMLFAGFLERYTADPLRFGAVFEGVIDVLDALATAGVKLGVCTNKPQAPTDRLLTALDLAAYFPVVIGGDHLAVKKPHADHINTVVERLGAERQRTVMIGDSVTDVRAAAASGVPCILVSFGYTQTPARALGANRVIDHFTELPAALASLGEAAA